MARKIATLRSFHKWLEKRGFTTTNPMTLIRTPKQARRLPKAITVDEVERLLSAPDDNDLLGSRDRAILETLYSTGIRVSEVVAINRGDLNEANECIVIRGKGRRERLVPLGAHALKSLRHYLDMLDAELRAAGLTSPVDAPLFVNKHGSRLSSRSVRRKVAKYLVKAATRTSTETAWSRARISRSCSGTGAVADRDASLATSTIALTAPPAIAGGAVHSGGGSRLCGGLFSSHTMRHMTSCAT